MRRLQGLEPPLAGALSYHEMFGKLYTPCYLYTYIYISLISHATSNKIEGVACETIIIDLHLYVAVTEVKVHGGDYLEMINFLGRWSPP